MNSEAIVAIAAWDTMMHVIGEPCQPTMRISKGHDERRNMEGKLVQTEVFGARVEVTLANGKKYFGSEEPDWEHDYIAVMRACHNLRLSVTQARQRAAAGPIKKETPKIDPSDVSTTSCTSDASPVSPDDELEALLEAQAKNYSTDMKRSAAKKSAEENKKKAAAILESKQTRRERRAIAAALRR